MELLGPLLGPLGPVELLGVMLGPVELLGLLWGLLGALQGGNVAGGGHCRGGALWPIDTHRARHKQSHLETGRPPPRAPVPWP